MHGARRPGGRLRGDDDRRPRGRRRAPPGAAGVPREARAPVRLLHARVRDGVGLAPEGEPEPVRGGDPPRARGQPLPLHRLPQHRQGGCRRPRRPARDPAGFDYARAGSVDEAIELLGATRREADRRRPLADPAAAAAVRAAVAARRHRPARRPALRARGRRPDRDRRAHAPCRRSRSTRCSRRAARSLARPPGTSATRRSATAARSAARSPTATPPPTWARSCSRSTPTRRRGPGRRAHDPGGGLLHRPVRDRARAAGAAHRDPRARGRRRRVPQVRPPRAGLGDGRRRRRAASTAACTWGWRAWAATPLRALGVEQAVAGGAAPAEAAAHAAEGTEPPSDASASARVPRASRTGARPPRARAAVDG